MHVEVAMVVLTNTVVNPGTVVVEPKYTPFANIAVPTPRNAYDLTKRA